jgi:hypothetical protein
MNTAYALRPARAESLRTPPGETKRIKIGTRLRRWIHEHDNLSAGFRLKGGLFRIVANRDVCAKPPWMGSRRS